MMNRYFFKVLSGMVGLGFCYSGFTANLCQVEVNTSDGSQVGMRFEPTGLVGGPSVICKSSLNNQNETLVPWNQYFNGNPLGVLTLNSAHLTGQEKVEFRFEPKCSPPNAAPAAKLAVLKYESDHFSAPIPSDLPLLHTLMIPSDFICPEQAFSCTYQIHVLVNGKELLRDTTLLPGFAVNPLQLQQEQNCYSTPHPQG